MDEGSRRDRYGRRRRRSAAAGASSQNQQEDRRYRGASSDSEVAGVGEGHRAGAGRPRCFFHEGLDVDQLARYRRRRVEDRPRDHLGRDAAGNEEEDEDEDELERHKRLVTEYRLAFRASSDDVFRTTEDFLSPIRRRKRQTDDESQKIDENSVANSRASYHVPLNNLNGDHGSTKDSDKFTNKTQIETDHAKIMEMGTDSLKRPAPIRRGTTLRYEGEFSADTESTSNYHAFPGLHRTELRRRGTSLRMEGDFDGRSEKDDKFIEWPVESCRRPEPIRLPGQLRLEGELETSTECHDKYVPFVGARRPEILRQPAHLKIEGDASWTAEYADVFREFNFMEARQAPKIPESSLRTGGGFFDKTETSELFRDPRDKEAELMAELAKDAEEEEEEKKKRQEEEERSRLKKEEEMKLLVAKLEDLKGPPLEIPEYKDAYKDFPRERPKLMKPEDEIGRADGSKAPASPSRFRTKIDQDPEYKSIFLDLSKDQNRPIFQRPPLSLRPSATSSRNSLYNTNNNYYRRDSRRSDAPMLSEIRSQYVNYGHQPKMESLRIPTNLRLEGDLDLEPEYRNAYCNSQPRGSVLQEPIPRRRERSNSVSRRRDSGGNNNNYWIDNDNGEQFGTVNAADDQDAFQVLQTRVHEESVVGKPPPGSRRNSRASLMRQPPEITLTAADRPPAGLRNRSPSPSYRLQVSHVDDEPRGFVSRSRYRRRSPSQSLLVQPTTERQSPSSIQEMPERSYSPSFARENSAATRQQQAFVVLDNNNGDDGLPRRRRTDWNLEPRDSLASVRASNGNAIRPRNRTPPNWMPPWYDSSTSTI